MCFFSLRSALHVPRPLASAVKPIREVSSVASGSDVLQVGRAHSTGITMMKLPAGLDDECVDALLILFAASNANLFLSRLVACHYLPTTENMS